MITQQPDLCRVWNNVEKPIGTTQLMIQANDNWNKYNKLIQCLNHNGYIVYVAKHNHDDNTTDIAEKIIAKHKLPLVLIANEFDTQQIKNFTTNTSLFDAVISVAEIPGARWWNRMIWRRFLRLENHAPILIINGGINLCKTCGRLSRTLHSAYTDYDPNKLTVILYPDICPQNLIDNQNKETQDDILNFLNDIKK